MASTYTLITSQTLSASATSVTFSSIPSTYTDLVLKCSTRDTQVGSMNGTLNFTLNGNTSTVYSTTYVEGYSASAASGRRSSQTAMYVQNLDSSGNTANTFTNIEIYIPSYTAAQNKPFSVSVAAQDNSANSTDSAYAGLFSSTTAISSITIPATSQFAAGSSFYLYGIKNS